LRINAVQFGGFDEGVGNRRRVATAFGAHEEIILSADGDAAHGAFGDVVIELQLAVIEIGAQSLDPREGIADGGGERGLAGDSGLLFRQPGREVVEDRFGPGLSDPSALIRWLAARLGLDGVELGDAFDCFFRDGGTLRRRCV
jgi:hypothetical protein